MEQQNQEPEEKQRKRSKRHRINRNHISDKDLRSALDLLEKVHEQIPHTPATVTKQIINDFLKNFRK